MKKILLFIILCTVWLTNMYAKSPIVPKRDSLIVSSFIGYPLTVGDATVDNLQLAANKLIPMDVELDVLPSFQIGSIPNQTVWHEGDAIIGFYVRADTLKASDVSLGYVIDFPPTGKITFNEQTGKFKYFPDKSDVHQFTVTFYAEAGNKMITQDVLFMLMPGTQPEYSAFDVDPTKPLPEPTDEYTIIAQTVKKNVMHNNSIRNVCSYSITGKELVFDSGISNKLSYLNERNDIYELNLYAEKIIIRGALRFPQTNLTIYTRELIFEDLPDREKASINTSPLMFDILSDGIGRSGADAGNITLYVQNYKQSVPHKRFIAIGGKGQNATWNTGQGVRAPGDGGNGGIITSTIDVSGLCDLIYGSAGIQINGSQEIVGSGKHGKDGSFALIEKEFTWLHPNFISAVVKHAKDAYLNIYNDYAYNVFSEYTQQIRDLKASAEWEELDEADKMELNNAENEMQALIFRIGQSLDYFGNPVGWVPMLSFEVNKLAFEQEIEKAIRVMYLSYWLKNIDRSNEERIDACNEAIESMKQELLISRNKINQWVLEIPDLQEQAAVLGKQIEDVSTRIENKKQELLSKAKSNVKKKNDANKTAGILSAVAQIAPVVCSIVPGVGTAVGMAISAAATVAKTALATTVNASDTYGYGDAIGGFLNASTGYMSGFETVKLTLDSMNFDKITKTAQDAYKSVSKTVDPLIKSMEKLHTTLAKSSTPNDQVQAELNKLQAESKEFQSLTKEVVVLNDAKTKLMQKLTDLTNGISTTSASMQGNMAAIDGLGRDVFINNSKRDLRAMQYLDDMDRRARERLLKYHYYMSKAYEYRLLKPYEAELNLSAMLDRFVAIAEANPNKPILDAADFQNLKAIYEEQLSTVTATILDEYNLNRPELTIPIRFTLPESDLDNLNSGKKVLLNIYDREMIPPNRENVRIVNFKIHDIKVHLEGTPNPSFANFELSLEHSGRSMMRKNGDIYWFDHLNNQNQNPISWGITYDAKYGIIDEHTPSFASQSLLYSLLEKLGQTNNIMIYSRPGAWSDISISKSDIISGNTKMIIDELTFELQYDFVQRPTNNRNLDVYAGDIEKNNLSFTPYIEISRTDKGGRADGRGMLYRTYNSGTTINLEAPMEYGRYQFVNWTNKYDEAVSTKTTVSTNMNSDTYLKANYRYMGPVLNLADTIRIGKNDRTVSVKVENKGLDEMEWSAISNTPWIKIISGTEEGIDTDYISLEIEQNPSETARTGSITVTAPETAEYSKEVKIIQLNDATVDIKDVTVAEGRTPKIIRQGGTDTYTAELNYPAKNTSIDVYSVNGQLVYRKYYYNSSTCVFELSNCPKGVYVVKIVSDGKSHTQKIVK